MATSTVPSTVMVAGEPVSVAPLRQAAVAVCRAAGQAKVDPQGARAGFYDNAHEPLHELARLVGEVNRARAGRLLETKEAVEADLDAGRPGLRLAADINRLAVATNAALAAINIPAAPCAG
jgi:hypothetical protein